MNLALNLDPLQPIRCSRQQLANGADSEGAEKMKGTSYVSVINLHWLCGVKSSVIQQINKLSGVKGGIVLKKCPG